MLIPLYISCVKTFAFGALFSILAAFTLLQVGCTRGSDAWHSEMAYAEHAAVVTHEFAVGMLLPEARRRLDALDVEFGGPVIPSNSKAIGTQALLVVLHHPESYFITTSLWIIIHFEDDRLTEIWMNTDGICWPPEDVPWRHYDSPGCWREAIGLHYADSGYLHQIRLLPPFERPSTLSTLTQDCTLESSTTAAEVSHH